MALKKMSKKHRLSVKWNMNTNLKEHIKTIHTKDLEKLDILLKTKGAENKNDKILSIPCFKPWFQMEVLNDGKVGYCDFFCEEEVAENARAKKLKDIWYGEYFEKVREEIIKGKLPNWCYMCPTSMVIDNEGIRNYLKKKIL